MFNFFYLPAIEIVNVNLTSDTSNVINSRHGITQVPHNLIGDSSQNGKNNNSLTLNMNHSLNTESADNSENSHTMLWPFVDLGIRTSALEWNWK